MQGHCKQEGGPRGAQNGCRKANSQKRGGIESQFKQLNEKLQEEEIKSYDCGDIYKCSTCNGKLKQVPRGDERVRCLRA